MQWAEPQDNQMSTFEVIEQFSNQLPVPIFEIISQLGLGPYFKTLDDDISGWIERSDNGNFQIVINERHSITRQRFTAAHELGHYIYHRDLLGKGTGDTRAYRAEASPLPNAFIRPRHERQANSFAANILMPVKLIEKLKREGVENVSEMADRLNVSQEALSIRLGSSAG